MVLVPLDPNDPQPRRNDERFGSDYKAFRRADKAWSERERNRRKRLKTEESQNAEPIVEPPIVEPPTTPHIASLTATDHDAVPTAPQTAELPAAPLSAADHDAAPTAPPPAAAPTIAQLLAFRWDRTAEKAAAERAAAERQERRVAAEAQAKRCEEEQAAAECYRLRLEKGERLLQEHVEQGARWRARDTAARRNRLAQLQGSEAAQNADAGSVAVACGVRAVAEENPEWRRIQATYHRSYIPRGVPEHLPARVRFSMEIFRVGAQDLASEPVVLRLPDYRANRPSDCGCGSGDRCAANEAKRLGHAPLAYACGRDQDVREQGEPHKCRRRTCWGWRECHSSNGLCGVCHACTYVPLSVV